MIQVSNLCKSYGDRPAVKDLNFSIKKGEVVGFLGPNGAGKSTTMKMLTGFMAPTSGDITIADLDIFENPLDVKRKIGYLPEVPPVYGDMYVRDYLKYVAELKLCDSHKIPHLVASAIAKTHLEDVQGRLIQNLSKGFKQRVGIAQALVADPEILILDEPTVGLDPKQVAEIRQLIQALRGQHTVILSTHILSEVQSICERVIIINKGEIVAEDSLSALKNRVSGAKKAVLRVLKSTPESLIKFQNIKGVFAVEQSGENLNFDYNGEDATLAQISEVCFKENLGLLELRQEAMQLEDIFIQLTSGGE